MDDAPGGYDKQGALSADSRSAAVQMALPHDPYQIGKHQIQAACSDPDEPGIFRPLLSQEQPDVRQQQDHQNVFQCRLEFLIITAFQDIFQGVEKDDHQNIRQEQHQNHVPVHVLGQKFRSRLPDKKYDIKGKLKA